MNFNNRNTNNIDICTFDESLNVFDMSEEDILRTTHRLKIYSYAKDAAQPIMYRHYKHYHDDEGSISGYRTQRQDYYTLFVFVDGKIGLFISDKLYTPGFGEIVTLKPEDDCTLFIYALENLEYYEFDFPAKYFNLIADNSPLHRIFSAKEPSGIELNANNTERLFHILNKTDKAAETENEHKDFVVYSLLIQAAATICKGNEQSVKLNPMLKNALKYISENLTSLTDTKQIADYCNVSVSYLCRIFKKNIDTSPLEYINNQKLLRAKFLLKSGYNVTEACFESGFDSYNYFITKFKKVVGMTPTEYQKLEFSEE